MVERRSVLKRMPLSATTPSINPLSSKSSAGCTSSRSAREGEETVDLLRAAGHHHRIAGQDAILRLRIGDHLFPAQQREHVRARVLADVQLEDALVRELRLGGYLHPLDRKLLQHQVHRGRRRGLVKSTAQNRRELPRFIVLQPQRMRREVLALLKVVDLAGAVVVDDDRQPLIIVGDERKLLADAGEVYFADVHDTPVTRIRSPTASAHHSRSAVLPRWRVTTRRTDRASAAS